MKGILHLTLKKKWFVEIAEEIKKHEYREVKPYWTKRLCVGKISRYSRVIRYTPKEFDEVWFKNGYNKNSPFMRVEWLKMTKFPVGGGKSKGCTDMYDIHLGKVLEIRNYTKK